MNKSGVVGALALGVSATLIGHWTVQADGRRNGDGGVAGSGPDVIVGGISGQPTAPSQLKKWGTVGGITAYSIGTTSCNIGDQILKWCDFNNASVPCTKTEHPVISQNLYRMKDGRFEQIGMSWLKHGFCALAENLCSPCQSDPFGCDALGVGCSDPYSTDLNGTQSNLGPLSQVNPHTGIFPYPFTAPAAPPTIGRRLQVNNNDVDPAQNANALYFAQAHYVHPQDCSSGTDMNNASYRRVTVGSLSGAGWNLNFTGTTAQQKPAIQAWKDHGLGANTPDPNVVLQNVEVPGDGRFIVGYKVSQIDETTWHYEFAIQNYNVDRSARSFALPLPSCVDVSNVGFHDYVYHSGEPFDGTDWGSMIDANGLSWQTVDAEGNPVTFAENPNANALRWSTLYNFRFDANSPPTAADATIGLFKSGGEGDPDSVTVAILVPSAIVPNPDLDGSGFVDGADLGLLLSAWETNDCNADLTGDGIVDGADLGLMLSAWSE